MAGPLALTLGDPAGIGPEIVVKALAHDAVLRARSVVVGDPLVLQDAIARYAPTFRVAWVNLREAQAELHEHDIALHAVRSLDRLPEIGRVSADAGRAAVDAIVEAAALSLHGHTCGMATAPVNKLALRAAGVAEPGHTEILARLAGLAGTERFAMMFASERLQVVLATIHLPLARALAALTPELVLQKIQLTHDAGRWLGRLTPRIAIAGINPHAGEGGMLGDDEQRVLVPAIARARELGVDVTDPLPPDTVFMRARTGEFDVVLAMYHDQGLIPVKLLGLDGAVNVTIGLPFLRSSVDHGTAFDIAGRGTASAANMLHVLRWHLQRVDEAAGPP
jgi:4-hydroxythreonine-4-phosphate dehydrogenase